MRPSSDHHCSPLLCAQTCAGNPTGKRNCALQRLELHLELDWGLAHEPLSSRSEAHCWLPGGRGLLRTGQGQGDVFTDSLCPHYPLPHPVWITWSKTPDFVIPPMVTCSCEQAVLGPRARCLDRPASPGLHTSHMSREGWTSFCTSSLGAEGESFLLPSFLG